MKTLISLFAALLIANTLLYSQAEQNQKPLPQPKLMVVPQATAEKDPVTLFKTNTVIQAAYTAITQVLTTRKLEIVDLTQALGNVDKMRVINPNFDSDPNAFIAANTGADVYLEFALELIKEGPTNKMAVTINVKESATAKSLGAGRGVSQPLATPDITSLTTAAVNNVIEDILQQIRNYWIETPKYGKPIKVTISSSTVDLNKPTPNNKRIDRELTRFLKDKTITYNREISTAKNLIFNPVYVDIYKYSDIVELQYELEDLFATFDLQYNSEVFGKEIIITLE